MSAQSRAWADYLAVEEVGENVEGLAATAHSAAVMAGDWAGLVAAEALGVCLAEAVVGGAATGHRAAAAAMAGRTGLLRAGCTSHTHRPVSSRGLSCWH